MKQLIVITGPTASGKTDVAIDVARQLGTEIISADSRQMFQGIPIATAAPTAEQLASAPHHFVQTLDLADYYSAAMFEQEAIAKIDSLFREKDRVVMCGGSMMYIDAVCNGIDNLPTVPDDIRNSLMQQWKENGDAWLRLRLMALDPEYYSHVDLNNLKRVFHAVEICLTAGVPYSSLLSGTKIHRNFEIKKYALTAPREILFKRINRRVEKMITNGLEDESRKVYQYRHLNSLNTVGLKEMFKYLDGDWDLQTAIARIQKNTRVYAKKQLTWWQRDSSIYWIDITKHTNPADEILGQLR